jgi:protein-tyrosine-phosphatase
VHWPVADPAAASGDEDDRLDAFRAARDDIQARIRAWLAGGIAA